MALEIDDEGFGSDSDDEVKEIEQKSSPGVTDADMEGFVKVKIASGKSWKVKFDEVDSIFDFKNKFHAVERTWFPIFQKIVWTNREDGKDKEIKDEEKFCDYFKSGDTVNLAGNQYLANLEPLINSYTDIKKFEKDTQKHREEIKDFLDQYGASVKAIEEMGINLMERLKTAKWKNKADLTKFLNEVAGVVAPLKKDEEENNIQYKKIGDIVDKSLRPETFQKLIMASGCEDAKKLQREYTVCCERMKKACDRTIELTKEVEAITKTQNELQKKVAECKKDLKDYRESELKKQEKQRGEFKEISVILHAGKDGSFMARFEQTMKRVQEQSALLQIANKKVKMLSDLCEEYLCGTFEKVWASYDGSGEKRVKRADLEKLIYDGLKEYWQRNVDEESCPEHDKIKEFIGSLSRSIMRLLPVDGDREYITEDQFNNNAAFLTSEYQKLIKSEANKSNVKPEA